jgi:hypothetical protein
MIKLFKELPTIYQHIIGIATIGTFFSTTTYITFTLINEWKEKQKLKRRIKARENGIEIEPDLRKIFN